MGMGGLIAGALGGLGGAVGQIATGQIEDQRKLTLAQQMSDMQEAASRRAAEFSADLGLKTKVKEATNAELQGALRTNDRAKLQDAADVQVGSDKLITQGRLAAQLEYNSDPRAQKAERAMAAAKHFETQASVEAAALSRLQRQIMQRDDQVSNGLLNDLATARASNNPDEVAKVQQKIADRAWSSKDDAKAHSTWQQATARIMEIETKLADKTMVPADQRVKLESELEKMRAVADAQLSKLNIKLPEKAAAPLETPNPAAIRKMQQNLDNPAAVKEFTNRFGADALAKVPRPGAAAAPATPAPGAAAATTGLEGLSRFALQRIADDPAHPRRAAALQMLRQGEAARAGGIIESMDAAWQQYGGQ